jgi:hypothetical protein
VPDVSVRAAVDSDAPSVELHWQLLRGHRAAYMPTSEVADFTHRAMTGKKLHLQVTDPHDGITYSEEFSLAGLPGALDYILPCGTARSQR